MGHPHADNASGEPVFSVVVPTYNRRNVVLEAMEALAQVQRPWPVELIVVVDGSSDGTWEAASALVMPLPTRVVMQDNAGAARARNHGAELAQGRYLLFLDDDMIVAPDILVRHEECFRGGADAVVGHMAVHPSSPDGLLKHAVTDWSEERRRRLEADEQITIDDLLTGQLSVRSELFWRIGGCDAALTEDGQFGGEDTDFGLRLAAAGARLAYAPRAISYQKYVVTPTQYLRQWSEAGRGDAMLARKHPETRATLVKRHQGPLERTVFRLGPRLTPPPVRRLFDALVLKRVDRGRTDRFTSLAFLAIREGRYWASFDAEERRSVPLGGPRVLAYHQVEPGPVASTPYSVTVAQLESHLATLQAAGYEFIDAQEYLNATQRGASNPKAVLVTFDDGYADLIDHAAPVLERYQVPAVAFAVTSLIGRWNAWDTPDAGKGVPLLDAAGLRELRARGWEIGSHSRTHAHLGQLHPPSLRTELEAPIHELVAAGLPAPRMLAYPYGEHNFLVRWRAGRAGYQCAFALTTTRTSATRRTLMSQPRIEVGRETRAENLLDDLRRPQLEARRTRVRLELRGMGSTVRAALPRAAR